MLFYAKKPSELKLVDLNDAQKQVKAKFKSNTKDKTPVQCLLHCLKQAKKEVKKPSKDKDDKAKTIYVLDFVGDIKASAVDKLREEISAIISVAAAGDEVMLRLESSGGQVHSYGLASAQLVRLKQAGIFLTVCVDKVAASGGYMMACVADKIVATPFAIIGSIGVVSQMPNFYEFLKKHDIDVELFIAGEYKRTVTMFGQNDDDDRAKYQAELERIHALFKDHIKIHRPSLDIERVATGEFWLGSDAHALGLVDELGTSDAWVLARLEDCRMFCLHSSQKPSPLEKLGIAGFSSMAESIKEALPFAKLPF